MAWPLRPARRPWVKECSAALEALYESRIGKLTSPGQEDAQMDQGLEGGGADAQMAAVVGHRPGRGTKNFKGAG